MNDPHNTQAYANEPYTKEAWRDLSRRIDLTSRYYEIEHTVEFDDIQSRAFYFNKVGNRLLLSRRHYGRDYLIFELSISNFRKLLHELNSFLKGG